jgi:hypothetical protein
MGWFVSRFLLNTMLILDLSSERVEAARTQNAALYRCGPLLVTPWRT